MCSSWTLVVAVLFVPGLVLVAGMFLPGAAVVTVPYPVNVVVLQEIQTELSIGYQQSMPVFEMAIDQVTYFSGVINFTFIHRNTSCNGDGIAALAADLHCDLRIGVFIGPACNRALDALLPLAKSWNIAVITPVGSGISDLDSPELVIKLSPYRRSSGFLHTLCPFNGSAYTPEKLSSLLVDASYFSRVFILACGSRESRALMLQAYHLRYATSGEYVFFIVDELSKVPGPDYWQIGQPDDEIVLKAMGHVIWPSLTVNLSMDNDFKKEVIKRTLKDYGYDYNGTKPSPYLAGYFDSVLLYARALFEMLSTAGGNPLNGNLITRRLQNINVVGAYGRVRINKYGVRENDVTFSYVHVKTGKLTPGAFYDSEMGLLDNISNVGFAWPYSGGVPPLNVPKCGFRSLRCVETAILSSAMIGIMTGLLGLVVMTGSICAIFVYRSWKSKQNADLWWWKIQSSDLMMAANTEFFSLHMTRSKPSLRQVNRLVENSLSGCLVEGDVAVWKGQTVGLRRLSLNEMTLTMGVLEEFKQGQTVGLRRLSLNEMTLTMAVLEEFKQLKDVNHTNLVRIYGACFEDSLKALVTEYCIKGSLQDLLGNMNITLDAQFKLSLCRDIINGLCYIHQSPIHQHGHLNSNVCLIDNRFSVKLTDFGLPTLYSNINLDVTTNEFKNECKWKAPEILRSGAMATGTMEGDIYSYGMILVEVITQDSPFAAETACMTTDGDSLPELHFTLTLAHSVGSNTSLKTVIIVSDEIIQMVQDKGNPPFRPAIELPLTLSNFKELIHSCWAENPKDRPSCQSVKSCVKQISTSLGDGGSLLENLMRRMELYANNLEKMVEEKTAELSEEKKKSETLLYQILPRVTENVMVTRSVADRLKSGLPVDPEVYEGVSIYFSDIVGFTEISALSSPMEVVDLLNDIYSCFDAIIEEFDVYKVETIGDAYMVVSGLPQRNGNLHALNIARMSIKVLETIREFRIRHMPTESVKIRIGLHSGPVCAGVVGSKMPRYCLFGDTVNTASRMESSGKAMMIHISPSIKALLDQFGSFHVLPRGGITVKGKGQMFTYWLQTSQTEPVEGLVDKEII